MNTLIVDDHQLFASGLELLLEGVTAGQSETKNISIVSSVAELQDLSDESCFDLILLDYHQPSASGEELFEQIKGLFPASDIVVISSDDSNEVIYTAMSLGAVGFISKSSSKKVLLSALELILSGGTYFPALAFDSIESKHNNLNLTKRQKKVLALAANGLQNKQIAIELGISEGTVKAHLHQAFRELGVSNRTQATLAYFK